MEKRKLNRKIHYIPGILSLALLSVLFYMQITNYLESRKENAINILNYNEISDNYYGSDLLPKLPADRKYIIFELNGHYRTDSLKLILVENILKGIELSKDTNIGIKVLFNNKLKYRTIIQSINSCLKSNVNTFFLHFDTLISYHRTFTYYDDTTSKYPIENLSLFPFLGSDINFYIPPDNRTICQKIIGYKKLILISTPYILWILIIAFLMFRRKNEC